MVRANIKISGDVYIGLIDEDDDGFRIMWNKNMDNYPEYDRSDSEQSFPTFEASCEYVHKVIKDAIISETIYFKFTKE